MKRALAAPICLLGIACHRAPLPPSADAGSIAAADDASAGPADAAPERACHVAKSATLSGVAQGDELEFGEAVRTPSGVAFVGLLGSSGGAAHAAVARVDGSSASVVDLGAPVPDTPPPQPFLRRTELFAVGYVRASGAEAGVPSPPRAARPLTVFRVSDVAERLVTVTQTSEESPSFDVIPAAPGASAGALLAWDEDAPDGRRGLIRLAVLGQDLRSIVGTTVASPETTDAERPALATSPTGYWLAWIARKEEPPRDAGPELEGPGEDRAYRWVELVALDSEGKPVGPVRRLTSATGHVSGFSMEEHGARLDLYASEEDELADGAGGSILHVAIDMNGPARVVPIVSSGTARGVTPAVVWEQVGQRLDDYEGHLEYVDIADHAWLIPLDRTGYARGAATLEPDLDDARLLAEQGGGQLLVASPRRDPASSVFRSLQCAYLHGDGAPAPFP